MKKPLLIGGFVALLAIGIFSFVWINQPNNGSIINRSEKDVLSAIKTTSPLDSNLFSTSFDSNLRIKTSNQTPNGPILSQYLLSSKNSDANNQIGITIAESDGNLEEVSPAKFRLLQPEEYQTTSFSSAPENSIVFIKNNGSYYEITVIWQEQNVYSAVVGSGMTSDKLIIEEQVSDVLNYWQWKL